MSQLNRQWRSLFVSTTLPADTDLQCVNDRYAAGRRPAMCDDERKSRPSASGISFEYPGEPKRRRNAEIISALGCWRVRSRGRTDRSCDEVPDELTASTKAQGVFAPRSPRNSLSDKVSPKSKCVRSLPSFSTSTGEFHPPSTSLPRRQFLWPSLL